MQNQSVQNFMSRLKDILHEYKIARSRQYNLMDKFVNKTFKKKMGCITKNRTMYKLNPTLSLIYFVSFFRLNICLVHEQK